MPETEETRKVKVTTQAGDCLVHLSNGRRYGSQLSTILRLFNEAKKDFPELRHEDVDIHFYGPPRLKGIMFIEFRAKPESIPACYSEQPGEFILA
jgi:hypothetical protein